MENLENLIYYSRKFLFLKTLANSCLFHIQQTQINFTIVSVFIRLFSLNTRDDLIRVP